ncbi:CRISPR-associated protein Cas5/CasD [Peptoniphilus sp. oral taxon 375 str. F0436]|nr:CRISPR-associated protein Cas5/CasD [Peptoniphilus sp. oral taxon 375 str. F0436]
MKTVLLKLTGPMQSWGTSSHFETRTTDYYPSKSAVLGIVAASLGYRRDNDEAIKKLNDLDFAVRVDQEGILSRDFHIARKLKANGSLDRNYVTNRYYLEDAVFVVALGHEDDAWMDEIIKALENPYFQPFMGRRSCPLPGDFILEVKDLGAIDALEQLPWQAADWYRKKHKNYRGEIYADKDLFDSKTWIMRKDQVISFSQKERKFGPRFESRKSQILSQEETEDLDFFEEI